MHMGVWKLCYHSYHLPDHNADIPKEGWPECIEITQLGAGKGMPVYKKSTQM